jgi:hypothetical protein
LEENETLRTSTRQQPILLQDHQTKKRSHPSSNQVGNRKRLKVGQIHEVSPTLREDADPMQPLPSSVPNEESEIPPTPREDADPMEPLPSSIPNEESDIFPIQSYTDPTESPPTPVPDHQSYTDPTRSPSAPVPNQVPETPPAQASTDITESPPTLVLNQVPECSPALQADTDPEELLPALVSYSGIGDGPTGALPSARRSSRIAERTGQAAEQRWGNGHLRDKSPRSACVGGGNRSEDEEEDVDLIITNIPEPEGHEDGDDEDGDDEDDDDSGSEDREGGGNDGLFAEFGVRDISAWDELGEGFEREAASASMFLAINRPSC